MAEEKRHVDAAIWDSSNKKLEEKMPKDLVLQPGPRRSLDPFRDLDITVCDESLEARSGPQSARPGSNHPSPTHLSESSLTGAVRVTAAITIAISLGAR